MLNGRVLLHLGGNHLALKNGKELSYERHAIICVLHDGGVSVSDGDEVSDWTFRDLCGVFTAQSRKLVHERHLNFDLLPSIQ